MTDSPEPITEVDGLIKKQDFQVHDNQAHPIRVHVSDNFLQLQQPLKEGRG